MGFKVKANTVVCYTFVYHVFGDNVRHFLFRFMKYVIIITPQAFFFFRLPLQVPLLGYALTTERNALKFW